jgi:hypothetical protein
VLPLRHGDYERAYKLYCIEVVETNAVWMRVWSVALMSVFTVKMWWGCIS